MEFWTKRRLGPLGLALAIGVAAGALTAAAASVDSRWSVAAAALGVAGLVGAVSFLVIRTRRDSGDPATSNEQLKRIIDSLQEGVALFDASDRLVMCNGRYREIFALVADRIEPGVQFEELIRLAAKRGQNIDAINHGEDWVQRRLAAHRQPVGRFEHHFTQGRWIWVEESKTSSNWTLSTYVDITHLKQRELELQTAKERAESADQLKRSFLSNLSHELRTPLNAIIGFSEIISHELLGEVTPHAYRGYAEGIHKSGEHLFQLIDRMLDMAKIEAGRMALEEEEVSIDELYASCLRFVDELAIVRGVEVTVTASGTVLFADELRLKQIVLNLLSNAVKFTPRGGSVRLSVDRTGGDPVIVVSDSGRGMTAEDIELAVTPFGQVESSYTKRHEGTGLGLPLATSLVELHGGDLTIESEPDVGTTVRVRLPRARLVPAGATATAAPGAA